jgi:Zn-dependent alcohol dehydrogenase
MNVAKAKKGQTIAIWGTGAVGLGAIRGAKDCGAKEIISIDRSNNKKEIALKYI